MPSVPARGTSRRFLLEGPSAFGAIWVGQLVSLFGTQLTGFGVSVWVFQQTHSATRYAMIALVATLPTLLLGPLAGAVADRKSRRLVMLAGDMGSALGTLALLVLFATGTIELWHLYLLVGATSVCSVFQAPAFQAAITTLVPKRQYGRVGGLLSLAPALVNLAAPPLAGFLLVRVGIERVLLLDLASFSAALLAIAMVRVPKVEFLSEGDSSATLWERVALGWRFIRERPGLRSLLGFQALVHVLVTLFGVLLVPMILGFASPAVAGTVFSAGGAGMLAGSLLMTVSGGPKRRIRAALGAGLVFGVGFLLLGARPSALWTGLGLFAALFAFPVIRASGQVVWRLKVPEAAQGRVFAVRTTLLDASRPLVLLAAGPLADRVFEPLMRQGGSLGDLLGPYLGSGPGRGIALIFILAGLAHLAASVAFYRFQALRDVENALPDAVDDGVRSAEERAPLSAGAPRPAPG